MWPIRLFYNAQNISRIAVWRSTTTALNSSSQYMPHNCAYSIIWNYTSIIHQRSHLVSSSKQYNFVPFCYSHFQAVPKLFLFPFLFSAYRRPYPASSGILASDSMQQGTNRSLTLYQLLFAAALENIHVIVQQVSSILPHTVPPSIPWATPQRCVLISLSPFK